MSEQKRRRASLKRSNADEDPDRITLWMDCDDWIVGSGYGTVDTVTWCEREAARHCEKGAPVMIDKRGNMVCLRKVAT